VYTVKTSFLEFLKYFFYSVFSITNLFKNYLTFKIFLDILTSDRQLLNSEFAQSKKSSLQKYLAAGIPQFQDVNSLPPEVMADVKEHIQNNYAMAEVFFQTLNVVNIVQTPMLDVTRNFVFLV